MIRKRTPRRVSKPDHVLVQHLPDDESVFLHLESERYFGLDSTGTAMWKALMETGTTQGAVEHLLEEFDVAPETLVRDLDQLVDDLYDRDLLSVEPDTVGTAPGAERG
jgi:hypothetical protein